MMKKLLFLVATVLTFSVSVKAQSAGTPTLVTDTLHYYFNKFYFKNGTLPIQSTRNTVIAGTPTTVPFWIYSNYPYYKSVAMTFTGNSHVGVRFENPDTMLVTGLEALVGKHDRSVNQLFKIPVRLFLCNLDANNKPKLPPVDSVEIAVSSSVAAFVGGNFKAPRKVTGDFAVLIRNVSTVAGDTLRIYRTSSATYTSWPGVGWQQKYSDGYGYVRFGNQFYSTTNYTTGPGFGYRTDYEFFLAPRVQYNLVASEVWPSPVVNSETICASSAIVFTNTSSKFYNHRMYNLSEFYQKWNFPSLLMYAPPGGWPVDSAITWKFDNEDNNNNNGGKLWLPYGGGTNKISFQTDSVLNPVCSDQNFFRANLYKMSTRYDTTTRMVWQSIQGHIAYQEMINLCIDYCNGDAVGLRNVKGFEAVSVYPNPSIQGKSTVKGLSGKNILMVYDMLGQLVLKEATDKERVTIDLSGKPNGNYLLRIVNDSNRSRSINIIKKTE